MELNSQICYIVIQNQMGENPLRCIAQDEKGLVFTTILFYLIF
jgi:hypothetical protein